MSSEPLTGEPVDLPQKKTSGLAWFCLMAVTLPLMVLSQAMPAIAALTRGSRGTQVSALQSRLREAGFFRGPITGFYGPKTEQAVRQFQASQGLIADGIVGSRTLAALRGQSVVRGQQAYSLKTVELQRLLRQRGFYSGPVDGLYGSRTRAAVKAAQQSLGVVADGIPGPMTVAALQRQPRSKAVAGQSPKTVELQQLLAERGFYTGPVNGIYGPRTRSAVRRAQQSLGLPADGVAGPRTMAALQSPRNVRVERSALNLVELQQLLTSKGFYAGPIDGVYGPGTRTAVRAAQQAYGLIVDGIPGPTTLAALRSGAVVARPRPPIVPASKPDILPVPAPPPRRNRASLSQNRQMASRSLELQTLLAQKGYYQGPIDGIYGTQTRMAVQKIQAEQGLIPDGIVGPMTLVALAEIS
ncbi:peptidoglycan-binding protein [Leptolyngbya sp. 'hensonii']|uniref:peptidoglycan-binding domain-containing protein n=1 Tax=Leptolyngbya sp. 'hensonii' TaxID=1922337 RepID=UPI00209B4AB1|nr:peptidoglycan-binding protein [Leptolyngbya sp. 'hensonii']